MPQKLCVMHDIHFLAYFEIVYLTLKFEKKKFCGICRVFEIKFNISEKSVPKTIQQSIIKLLNKITRRSKGIKFKFLY